ncbi:MAG TPA: SCO family protein [Acidobacteriota bacterium]
MILIAVVSASLRAQTGLPPMLRQVGIQQRLGGQIPLDLRFRNERNEVVRIGDYFGERPVVLALVYYECPMLCTQVLNGLAGALRAVPMEPGEQFDILAISFNAKETAELAARKKETYLERYGRASAGKGWHFLTGDQEPIDRLAGSVGFRYSYDPASRQFAHASGIMVLTPDGKISRYLPGIEYDPRDLKLALLEASGGRIGSPADRLLLYCYQYDPATGKYGPVIMNLVRLSAIATVLALAALMLLLRRKSAQPADSEFGGN